METLTLEPGGTVTEAPVAALAPADAGMTATFTLDSGKAEKLVVGAALTSAGRHGCQHHGVGHLRAG
ncbi:MAG: hypothetical protein ACLR7U_04480 [Ruthenibacterium lactatiformans]